MWLSCMDIFDGESANNDQLTVGLKSSVTGSGNELFKWMTNTFVKSILK